MLLERLQSKFPGVDFDARTFVAWTDGPTEAEVRDALEGFVNGEGVFQRTISPEFQKELEKLIEQQSGVPFNVHRMYEGGFRAHRSAHKTPRGYGNEQIGFLAEQSGHRHRQAVETYQAT